MNIKKTLWLATILMFSQNNTHTNSTYINDEMYDVLSVEKPVEKKEESEDNLVYYRFEISQNLLDTLQGLNIEPIDHVVLNRKLSELKDTPLFMKWTRRHIGEFLWYNQYQDILKKYNTIDSLVPEKVNEYASISFPLISDVLDTLVPKTISDVLQRDDFQKYAEALSDVDNLIVVMKSWEVNHVLAYYVNQNLFLASSVSIGPWTSTPNWLFDIQRKIPDKRSIKYKNAAMPYALYLVDNVFIHQWYVDWQPRSKWCIRVPWLYEEILYYHTKIWTKVLIVK